MSQQDSRQSYPQQPVSMPPIVVKQPRSHRVVWAALAVVALLTAAVVALRTLPGSGLLGNTRAANGGISATLPGRNWQPEIGSNVSDTPGWRTLVWKSSDDDSSLFAISIRDKSVDQTVETLATITNEVIDDDNGIAFNCTASESICDRKPVMLHGLEAIKLDTEVLYPARSPNAYHTLAYVFEQSNSAYYVQVSMENRLWSSGGQAKATEIMDGITH